MRRILAGFLVFFALTATFLVLPVYAAPSPKPHPVEQSADEVVLGSVVDPAKDAVVATDGEVQPGGVNEATATASPSSPASTPESPSTAPVDESVVVSGEELPGVPALTVSQPDTDTFSSVGVTWRSDPSVVDVKVQLRVKDADGGWGEWTTLEPDDTEQNATSGADGHVVRDGTPAYWTGEAHGIEVIVQGADGSVPRDVRLTMIDPGKSAADHTPVSGPQDQAHAAQAMPAVITRAEWGADPALMGWTPEYPTTIKAATLHHTADRNDYTADQVFEMIRATYYYHSVTRDWGDIGYNVIVDKFGRIFEGRYGGLTSTVVGAHAGGFNTYTFGVSMLGNYDLVPVPKAAVDAVSAIIAWKFSLYGVNPNGTAVLTSGGTGTAKYAAGVKVTLPAIFGHRDVGNTACPGRYGYAKLGEIRDKVGRAPEAASLVNALYTDVLGRAPAAAELGSWTKAVMASGDRWVAVRGFSGSEEYRRRFVAQAYEDILGRSPEGAGVDFWVKEMAAGRTTPDRLRKDLMLSQEFYLRGGGTDEGFVDLMYQRSFNRTASTSEQALWAGTARTKGRAEVIRGIWDSYESALHRVDRGYRRWLARAATSDEQSYWSAMVVTAGDESMREAALVSPEYLARSVSRFP